MPPTPPPRPPRRDVPVPPAPVDGSSLGWTLAVILTGAGALVAILVAVVLIRHNTGLATPVGTASPTVSSDVPKDVIDDSQGRFEIVFPAPPAKATAPVSSPFGPLTSTRYELSSTNAAGQASGYLIAFVTYPKSVDVSHPSAHLTAAMQGQIAGVLGTPVGTVTPVTIGGQPGLVFTVQVKGGYLKTLVLLRDHTLYTVEVFGVDAAVKTFDQFVATFTLN